MTQTIKIRNEPAQHIGVANSAPCPEMNIVAKEITENGRYEARAEGVTGFDPVIVNVPSREEIGYENGYNDGYGKGSTDGYADALAKRTELEVTANGEYIPEGESTGFSKVSVNLPSDTAVIDGLISGTLSGAYRNDRVTKVRQYGLAYTNLTSIDLPNVTNLDSYAIYGCNQLKTANVPLAKTVNTNAFHSCSVLQYVSLPSATNISYGGFANCYVLKTVILGGTKVVTLTNTNAFDSCYHIKGKVHATHNPEGLADGFIFVPDNLLEDYRQATNWSTLADRIKPISELEE
jgi:hypothetical protein